jgi:hypothetical protein
MVVEVGWGMVEVVKVVDGCWGTVVEVVVKVVEVVEVVQEWVHAAPTQQQASNKSKWGQYRSPAFPALVAVLGQRVGVRR